MITTWGASAMGFFDCGRTALRSACADPRSARPQFRLFEQVLQDKQCVGRAFRQSPHEIGIPFMAEGDVDAYPPAFFRELLLQIAADAIEHLTLERLGGVVLGFSEINGRPDHVLVMGGY